MIGCRIIVYHCLMKNDGWQPTPIQSDEAELKTAFAVELLKTPTDPFKAALAVCGVDTGKALFVANKWPSDAFVLSEISRLKEEEGELAFLPTKADLARSLWERAHSETRRTTNEDFVKLTRLYAEIMDFVPKVQKEIDPNKGKIGAQVFANELDQKL